MFPEHHSLAKVQIFEYETNFRYFKCIVSFETSQKIQQNKCSVNLRN